MSAEVVSVSDKNQTPSVFEYGGTVYASNLFKLHDTHGITLNISTLLCMERGWVPCFDQFVIDAVVAELRPEFKEKRREWAIRTVEEAKADTGYGGRRFANGRA